MKDLRDLTDSTTYDAQSTHFISSQRPRGLALRRPRLVPAHRKVDVSLPRKGNSNSKTACPRAAASATCPCPDRGVTARGLAIQREHP